MINPNIPNYDTSERYDVLLSVQTCTVNFEYTELEVDSGYDNSYVEIDLPLVAYRANLIKVLPTYYSFLHQDPEKRINYRLDRNKIKDDVIQVLGLEYLPFFE